MREIQAMRESESGTCKFAGRYHLHPVCMKSRFNRAGFAADIEMPAPGRPLGPVTYSTLGFWAPLISCPRNCREYEHPVLAKLKATLRYRGD